MVNLVMIGCDFRSAPLGLRERLAFDDAKLDRALDELVARYDCEAVILSTCNRVEMYLARSPQLPPLGRDLLAEFLGEFHGLAPDEVRPHLVERRDDAAIRHLFRVASSLDSLVVGEAQIVGQVKRAYERACQRAAAGPFLHALFQQANATAKRVRRETGIAQGHVSVSSVAVDYVREVFSRFDDKTILVIGAGKMGALTLRHLRQLKPRLILVTNRSPERASALAMECGGKAIPWEALDEACVQADIILSTTGAPEPIMPRTRWENIRGRKEGRTSVILDIAVPRDFDPAIHDGDQTCLFNVDDLKAIREQTLAERQRHVGPAEAIVEQEQRRFLRDWSRRRYGPLIARLTQDCDAKRQAIVQQLMAKLNGRLSDDDRRYIEKAFHLLQNQILHGPISALDDAASDASGAHLLEALRKLFRLPE
ncbi:MAG: glutamyl-tRNA reductase [Gemmataceae bacterium]|nr:glutamyl-tRNA reductase [Gemmataceae bacterium]